MYACFGKGKSTYLRIQLVFPSQQDVGLFPLTVTSEVEIYVKKKLCTIFLLENQRACVCVIEMVSNFWTFPYQSPVTGAC